METFGQRFSRLRKANNLTQEDIAKSVNVTSQSVSKWENDLSTPDIFLLPKLSELLHVSIEELLTGEVKEPITIKKDKDYNKAILRLFVNEKDGDVVKINFPVALGEMLIKAYMASSLKDKEEVISNIDFEKIFELIKEGVVGELLSVTSKEGDEVIIKVEY